MLTNVRLAEIHPLTPEKAHPKRNEFVFVSGMDLTKIICSNCGQPTLKEDENTVKCTNCGMGKTKNGKR
jgi:uncharacterized Zn finger protein (UPF0148 family)